MEYRWENIERALADSAVDVAVKKRRLPAGFGIGVDERIVEYPWIVSRLEPGSTRLLDAGSN